MACYFNDKKVLPLADFSQTDSFDSRRTANGEKILSPSFALVEKIKGKTVKSTNLIPFPYWRGTQTVNGLTFTNNADGTITINGTATATTSYHLYNYTTKKMLLPVGTYTISDGDTSSDIYVAVALWSGGTWIRNLKNSNDADPTFTITQDMIDSSYDVGFNFYIAAGKTYNNVLIKPMLNEGPTAKPYTPYFAGLKNATISGIKSTGANLIPFPYTTSAGTINGVQATIVEGNKIRFAGTPNADIYFYLGDIYLKAGTYYTSINVEGEVNKIIACTQIRQGGSFIRNELDAGVNGGVKFTITEEDEANNRYARLWIIIAPQTTAIDIVVGTMLNKGPTAKPYSQYAESTYQLPESYELGEWDSINPIEKTITRRTETIVFDGTENWGLSANKYFYLSGRRKNKTPSKGIGTPYNYEFNYGGNGFFVEETYLFIGEVLARSFNNDVASWKAHLAELANAGNPLTVAYELQTSTTETVEDLPRGYTAHKDGTETYLAGETDNSEWGAIPEFTLNYPKIMKEGTFNG